MIPSTVSGGYFVRRPSVVHSCPSPASSSSPSFHSAKPCADHASSSRGVRTSALFTKDKQTTKTATTSNKNTTQKGKTQSGSRTAKGTTSIATRRGTQEGVANKNKGSQIYLFFTGFPFPIGPLFQRKTVRYEVERGTIWTFEQTYAIENFQVYTPVRMTVIKLKSGGLWVHAPVAPTDECIRLIKELNAPVEYIVLPTYAYEHKAFVGPFSRKFPKAKVYICPYQWSFPLNLPPQFFGIFPAGELKSDDPDTPWADEIEQKAFVPPPISAADYIRTSEVAFFHKRTKTLLVTDAVVYIDDKPPEVIPDEALLENGRDNWLNRFVAGGRSPAEVKAIARTQLKDTEENRRRGWKRMALLVLYFQPSDLLTPEASFDAIANRLFVGPVVETLVYSKVPATVCAWVDSMCNDWQFKQIIPAHFKGPIKAGPADLKRAFGGVYSLLADRPAGEGANPSQQPAPVAQPTTPAPQPFWASWFGRQPSTAAPAAGKIPKAVEFPEADISALKKLNKLLLSTKLVRGDADALSS